MSARRNISYRKANGPRQGKWSIGHRIRKDIL